MNHEPIVFNLHGVHCVKCLLPGGVFDVQARVIRHGWRRACVLPPLDKAHTDVGRSTAGTPQKRGRRLAS